MKSEQKIGLTPQALGNDKGYMAEGIWIDTTKRDHKKEHPWQTILGNVPSKSNCYRIVTINGHGSLAKTIALRKYEESFAWQCNKYRDKNISNPFELWIDVFYPSKRSDLDGVFKCVLDCLQRIKAIKNDNLVMKITARKFIDKANPRIEFQITEV